MSGWTISPGQAYPLGATLVAEGETPGVNFALVSTRATRVELCLFDAEGHEQRLVLPTREHEVHCGFVPGASAGLVYGYRVHGPYQPEQGLRFNPHKLLLDPYAREIVGHYEPLELHCGYRRGHPEGERALDTRDNAVQALRARVTSPLRTSLAAPPRIPLAETLLYELHVKGFTKLNTQLPPELRGTYAGLAHPASVDYLRALGVTSLSLLPVHYSLSEPHLRPLGLRNYWGYNTIGFFCPDPRLSSTPEDPSATRAEFRAMVSSLHAAGLEVLLDVVFNHSAEAGADGPTLSFRGIDNTLYYRLDPDAPHAYLNWSGCGNSLDLWQPRVTQLVLDSLRYWVAEMGVDGFRFDLAPALGRTRTHFDAHAPLLVALDQDPILRRAKLIAEPWDLGPEGYQAGRFPGRFCEWNDHYRDDVRRVWLRGDRDRGAFARRLAGSSDRFHHGLRRPSASVNFLTAHDGFPLADALSYDHKHNLANGEHNRDGHSHEISHNCGVEGDDAPAQVLATRQRLARAMLTTLLSSLGTPMLLAGDELGHSQGGNNNAYCQDNAISWIDWDAADLELLAFVRHLIQLRRELAVLRVDQWLSDHGGDTPPVEWLRPDGAPLDVDDWHDPSRRALAMILGSGPEAVALLFNPDPEPARFRLPPEIWCQRLDSAALGGPLELHGFATVSARAVVILSRPPSATPRSAISPR